MGARELGQLCETARRHRGWSLARMAYEIGLVPPEDRVLNESQAKRILEGRRGLDEWMVQRLIDIFDLDAAVAWKAAGLWPPDLDVAGYRAYRQHALASTTPTALTRQSVKHQAQVRRVGVLIPFPVDRRRRDRRKPAWRPAAPELLRVS